MFCLADFCRLCLRFEGEFSNMCNDNIMEKVAACITDLEFDDYLPALICTECLELLDMFFNFRNQCLRSEFLLNGYVDKLLAQSQAVNKFVNTKLRVNVARNFRPSKFQSTVKLSKKSSQYNDSTSKKKSSLNHNFAKNCKIILKDIKSLVNTNPSDSCNANESSTSFTVNDFEKFYNTHCTEIYSSAHWHSEMMFTNATKGVRCNTTELSNGICNKSDTYYIKSRNTVPVKKVKRKLNNGDRCTYKKFKTEAGTVNLDTKEKAPFSCNTGENEIVTVTSNSSGNLYTSMNNILCNEQVGSMQSVGVLDSGDSLLLSVETDIAERVKILKRKVQLNAQEKMLSDRIKGEHKLGKLVACNKYSAGIPQAALLNNSSARIQKNHSGDSIAHKFYVTNGKYETVAELPRLQNTQPTDSDNVSIQQDHVANFNNMQIVDMVNEKHSEVEVKIRNHQNNTDAQIIHNTHITVMPMGTKLEKTININDIKKEPSIVVNTAMQNVEESLQKGTQHTIATETNYEDLITPFPLIDKTERFSTEAGKIISHGCKISSPYYCSEGTGHMCQTNFSNLLKNCVSNNEKCYETYKVPLQILPSNRRPVKVIVPAKNILQLSSKSDRKDNKQKKADVQTIQLVSILKSPAMQSSSLSPKQLQNHSKEMHLLNNLNAVKHDPSALKEQILAESAFPHMKGTVDSYAKTPEYVISTSESFNSPQTESNEKNLTAPELLFYTEILLDKKETAEIYVEDNLNRSIELVSPLRNEIYSDGNAAFSEIPENVAVIDSPSPVKDVASIHDTSDNVINEITVGSDINLSTSTVITDCEPQNHPNSIENDTKISFRLNNLLTHLTKRIKGSTRANGYRRLAHPRVRRYAKKKDFQLDDPLNILKPWKRNRKQLKKQQRCKENAKSWTGTMKKKATEKATVVNTGEIQNTAATSNITSCSTSSIPADFRRLSSSEDSEVDIINVEDVKGTQMDELRRILNDHPYHKLDNKKCDKERSRRREIRRDITFLRSVIPNNLFARSSLTSLKQTLDSAVEYINILKHESQSLDDSHYILTKEQDKLMKNLESLKESVQAQQIMISN